MKTCQSLWRTIRTASTSFGTASNLNITSIPQTNEIFTHHPFLEECVTMPF